MTQSLIIDIETRGNDALLDLYVKAHRPERLGGETDLDFEERILGLMAIDQDFCEIVCIGIKQLGGEVRILDDIRQLGTEKWYNWISQSTLITFAGKRFDLPILIKHGIHSGVNLPYERLRNACKPFGYADRSIDLMLQLAGGGKWQSMDTYLRVYLGIKKETLGSEFFRTATDEDLKIHCAQDLEFTAQLYEFTYGKVRDRSKRAKKKVIKKSKKK